MKQEKIEEFLRSEDIEMVRLGAVYLEAFIPRGQWGQILKDCSGVKEIPGLNDLQKYHMWLEKKWDFEISHDKITIKDSPTTPSYGMGGLWQKRTRVSNPMLTIHTGKAGLNLISEAMQKYYSNYNLNQQNNEQTKKKQYRKQSK